MRALRSFVFTLLFYVWTALSCVALVWMLLLPRRGMVRVITAWAHSIVVLERVVLGLTWRIEGLERLPPAPFILAPKHQAAWETLKLHLWLDDPAIVLKKELTRLPLWGWYMDRAGLISVDRRAGLSAMIGLLRRARAAVAEGRPIVIFPQGTRTPPGARAPYQPGVGLLYKELALPVVPVALDSGRFWTRGWLDKRGGRITVEVLPPIPPGLPPRQMLARLEAETEAAVDRLLT